MIVIGIDFGMRYWGVALGHAVTEHTEPLGSLNAESGVINFSELDQWIKSYQVDAIVIGYPLKQDNSEFKISKHAMQAYEALKAYYTIPVYQINEHMTSVEARDELFKHKGKRGLEKSQIDVRSAQLILERWFDSRL